MFKKILSAIFMPVLILISTTFLTACSVGENFIVEATDVTTEHPIIGTWFFVDDPFRVLYSEPDGIPFSGTLTIFSDGFAQNTHLSMRGHRTGNWRVDGDQLYIYRSEELRLSSGSAGLGADLPGVWTFSISDDGNILTLEKDETIRIFTRAIGIHNEIMQWGR